MKSLLSQDSKKSIAANQDGQSLVEFVLLLGVIMVISLGFLKILNSKVSDYWLAMGNILVEDQEQTLELR